MTLIQFKLKIPSDLKETIVKSAEANERSQAREIIFRLRQAYGQADAASQK